MLKKLVSFVLVATLVLTVAWNCSGGVKEVFADGVDSIVLEYSIVGENVTINVGTGIFLSLPNDDELNIEFGNIEEKNGNKCVISKMSLENTCKDNGLTPKAVIVNDRIYKYGEPIKITKNDYKKTEYGTTELRLIVVTDGIKNQWFEGFWFDGDGNNTYSARAQWYGSGSACWYQDSNGWYPVSSWNKIKKFWYVHDIDGYSTYDGWYYFDENGYAACDGWYQINGSWYYFDEKCWYESNAWRDGYYINDDGTQTYAYIGGWNSDSNGWWYSDSSGWYATSWTEIDGVNYLFKPDGYMACDEWATDGYSTYGDEGLIWWHFDSSGKTDGAGWYDRNGNWHGNN